MRRRDWTTGTLNPGRYPPDGRTPAEAMAAIRHAPVEIGYGYDADGRLRFIQVGDANGIAGFDERDLIVMRNGLFVHNHPPYNFPLGDPRRRAGSSSSWDLVFIWENDFAEIIAVTSDRNYFLRRSPGGFYLDPGQIREGYAEALARVQNERSVEALLGLISLEESLSRGRWADEVMDALGILYDYTWTEVKP